MEWIVGSSQGDGTVLFGARQLALLVLLHCFVVLLGGWMWKRSSRPKHVVALRLSWQVWSLNCLLWLPCVLVDWVGYEVPRVGYMLRRPLSFDRLKRMAERRTKLSDWGDTETFEAMYNEIISRLNEVDHTPVGRVLCFDNMLRRLMVRLEVVEAAKSLRTTEGTPRAPIFVLGLPRTGTTFLHRLLALDPRHRYPETHELLQPVSTKFSREKRIRFWDAKLNQLKTLVPQIEAIHEIGAREAEECLLAMSLEVPMLPTTFRHLIRLCCDKGEADTIGDLPSLRNAYSLYKTQLQLLALEDAEPSRRWVLKCPAHLGFIDDLTAVFPDAKLVWTHRDPAQALPSLGSMFRTFADMCERQPCNLHDIGAEQLQFWSTCVEQASVMLRNRRDGVAHVKYKDLIQQPLATVEHLYDELGLTVSDKFRANATDYLHRNRAKRDKIPHHIKRFHAYTLEEYGLSREDIRAKMIDYYTTYIDDQDEPPDD